MPGKSMRGDESKKMSKEKPIQNTEKKGTDISHRIIWKPVKEKRKRKKKKRKNTRAADLGRKPNGYPRSQLTLDRGEGDLNQHLYLSRFPRSYLSFGQPVSKFQRCFGFPGAQNSIRGKPLFAVVRDLLSEVLPTPSPAQTFRVPPFRSN